MRYIYHYLSLFIYIPPKICERSHGGVIAPVEGVTDVSIGSPLANVRLLKYCSTTSNPKKQRLSKGFFVFFAKISSLPIPYLQIIAHGRCFPLARVIFVGGLPRDATEVGGEKCHGESTLPGLGNGFPMIYATHTNTYIYIYIWDYKIYEYIYVYIYFHTWVCILAY